MKNKKLLAIILLSLGFCFVSGVGYGEISQDIIESKVSLIDFYLLEARVNYIMSTMWNSPIPLFVWFYYDSDGRYGKNFPEGVDTKGKICVKVGDYQGLFSNKSGIALLEEFKKELEDMYFYINNVMTMEMNTDIAAVFYSKGQIPLGYFYQGEYHLWEE